jgi:hypothetical protein
MNLIKLFRTSPLGCVGIFLMGGVYSALFGMAAVWGALVGLSVLEISAFVASIYLGGLLFQYPIGLLSDRMDRRRLIIGVSGLCMLVALVGAVLPLPFAALLGVALLIGGFANPLYSLLLAHTNDFLQADDMAGASGGLAVHERGRRGRRAAGAGLDDGRGRPAGLFPVHRHSRRAAGRLRPVADDATRRPRSGRSQGTYTPLTPSASALTLETAFEAAQPDGEEGEAHATAR